MSGCNRPHIKLLELVQALEVNTPMQIYRRSEWADCANSAKILKVWMLDEMDVRYAPVPERASSLSDEQLEEIADFAESQTYDMFASYDSIDDLVSGLALKGEDIAVMMMTVNTVLTEFASQLRSIKADS